MPEDQAQIYGAISIDNNILKGCGYEFDQGLLRQLSQFANSPITIVFSDVIHNEAKKHLASGMSEARKHIKKGLRSALYKLNIPQKYISEAKWALAIDGSDEEIAERRLNQYYNEINAEIIDSEQHLDSKELMKRYFATQPPFELKKEKKNEFPDAVALIGIEDWAAYNDTKVLVVSKDKGWEDYAKESEWLTVKKDLAEAIEKVQPENQVKAILEAFHNNGFLEDDSLLYSAIKDEIENHLEMTGPDIYIEAFSSFYYEYECVEAEYLAHKFYTDEDGKINVTVVGVEEDQIILIVNVDVKCEVSASFDFSTWDSIDKEYIGLKSGQYSSIEEEFHADILIELYGDFNRGYADMDIGNITVSGTIGVAEFGEIEPDWGDYEE